MALLRGALVILGLASVKSSPLLEVKLSDDGGCLEIEGYLGLVVKQFAPCKRYHPKKGMSKVVHLSSGANC